MSTLLLVVDDEPLILNVLKTLLRVKNYEVLAAENATKALEILREKPVDLMLTDVRMAPIDGVELLKRAKEMNPQLPVVLMTAYATVSTAVAAVEMGAFDFITKPFRVEDLVEILEHALDSARAGVGGKEGVLPSTVSYRFGKIIAESPEMQRVCQDIERVAATSAPSLLCGEIGTGKSLIAEAIHECSPRKGGNFVILNCAETPRPVIELRLFGPPGGAAAPTSNKNAEGLLQADGAACTILLDEIMMMPPRLLEKLTLYLARGLGGRSGGNSSSKITLILAADATLKDLSQMGGFATLLSRITGVKIEIKPLRERKEDILPLLSHFFHERIGDWNKLPVLAPDAHEVFMQYPWPGNVTELAGIVNDLFPQLKDGRITKGMLPAEMIELAKTGMPATGEGAPRADYRGKLLKAFLRTHLTKKEK